MNKGTIVLSRTDSIGDVMLTLPMAGFRWTHGSAAAYASSASCTRYFCAHCGCAPFGEANDPKRGHTVALNVRCIPALDLSTIEVKKVDGRSL